MIIADQTLHGYANGHQMIASSYEWNLEARRKMDILSDLNSRCNKEDLSYYMGYPINDGKQYVIAKTWYAGEMSRPGCVWTHSLVFATEDVSKISNFQDIMAAFRRPENNNYENYSGKIKFEEGNDVAFPSNSGLLEYLIYTIYRTVNPRIVSFDNDEAEAVQDLFFCIHSMPYQLLKDFSFTTMAYEIRSYDRKLFTYQVTTKWLVEDLKRRTPKIEVCVPYIAIEKMPYWVSCFCDYLKEGKIDGLYSFISNYGEQYFEWRFFNGFIRMYFLLQSQNELMLDEYIHYLLRVIQMEDDSLSQRTIDLILEDRFLPNSFSDVAYQILENLDVGVFKLSKKQNETLLNKILEGKLENLFPLLCKYKEGKLKQNTREILERIVLSLKPNDLKRVSRMDEDICIILVRMNHKLLLSEDIWKSSREFQISMLYSAGKWDNSQNVSKLLKLVIHEYKANVSDEMYHIYGNEMIDLVLETIKEEPMFDEYLIPWCSVAKKEPDHLMNALVGFKSRELSRYLFCELDMRDEKLVTQVNTSVWEALFETIFKGETNNVWKKKIGLQYVVLIFSIDYRFQNELVESVLKPIYNSALRNSLDMKAWYYFQYLLPELEPCYAWDKCKRIREALNRRGYKIKDINA